MTNRARLTAAALPITFVVAAGCSSPHSATARPPTRATSTAPSAPTPTSTSAAVDRRPPGVPDPATVDRHNAGKVAAAALITYSAIDSTTDDPQSFQRDAELRAAPYFTSAFKAEVSGQDQQPAPMSVWDEWTRHRAYLAVKLTRAGVDQAPPSTSTAFYKAWTVTTTPRGRDGWTGTRVDGTAFVTLSRDAATDPWQVSAISLQG